MEIEALASQLGVEVSSNLKHPDTLILYPVRAKAKIEESLGHRLFEYDVIPKSQKPF